MSAGGALGGDGLTDSLVAQCDTRMRWAQLKQRLCAQEQERGPRRAPDK